MNALFLNGWKFKEFESAICPGVDAVRLGRVERREGGESVLMAKSVAALVTRFGQCQPSWVVGIATCAVSAAGSVIGSEHVTPWHT